MRVDMINGRRIAIVATALLAACIAGAGSATAQALAPTDQPISFPPAGDAPASILPGILPRGGSLAPISPSSPTKTVLSLSALFAEGSQTIGSGLRWRVFADQTDVNGNHALVVETIDPRPLLTLDPGGYVVHVSYGLVTMTRHVVLGTSAESLRLVLDTGALRFTGRSGNRDIPPGDLNFQIHRNDGMMEELVADDLPAGEIVRLPAGAYQVTSIYGNANARVVSEIRVEAGKLTDAAVLHKAGRVQLRLDDMNGSSIPDASWTVLTPGGDAVIETTGTTPSVVLSEGEYVAIARHDGKTFQKSFDITSGDEENIALAIQ
jgi:hypothetical protein